jgi:hypothetical protein
MRLPIGIQDFTNLPGFDTLSQVQSDPSPSAPKARSAQSPKRPKPEAPKARSAQSPKVLLQGQDRCCFRGKTGAASGASLGSRTSLGPMDTLLETNTHYIIFELKIGGQPKKAVTQISSNHYAQGLSDKPVLGIGVVFDLETKSISAWEVEEL